MIIKTNRLFIVFFCLSTTIAIAMSSKQPRKDLMPVDINALLNIPYAYDPNTPSPRNQKKYYAKKNNKPVIKNRKTTIIKK